MRMEVGSIMGERDKDSTKIVMKEFIRGSDDRGVEGTRVWTIKLR